MFHTLMSRSIMSAAMLTVGLGGLPGFAKQPKGQPINGTYAFRMTPAKSFTADAPGDPGGIAGAPRQDVLRVGFFTADGNGNLTGHTLATTDTNDGKTWLVSFDWLGKYLMNADGTGFFSVDTVSNLVCTDMTVPHTGPTPHPAAVGGTPSSTVNACDAKSTVEGHEDYAFVFSTPGGKSFEFIQTDNDGGGAKIFMTGTATKNEDQGQNNQEGQGKGH